MNVIKLGSVTLFLLSLLSLFFKVRILGSEWLMTYGLCLLGFLLGLIALFLKSKRKPMDKLFKLGLYGNLLLVILLFPPFYFIWGTFLFGP